MNKKRLLISSILAFSLAGTALGAEFIAPKQDGDPNITISASETHNNLYIAGANATVNGPISGDLYVSGGMVTVIGDVKEDLNTAGGSISLSGKVGGDARVVGGNLTISSPIGGDLLIAGGNINITEKATIGGDLIVAGGNIILDAPVSGKVQVMAGNLTINSKVGKGVSVRMTGKRKNEGNLIFGSKAEVLGGIQHKGAKPAVVKEGAKVGEINYILTTSVNKKALVGVGAVVKFLAVLLAVLILVKWQNQKYKQLTETITMKFWENLGIGLVGVIVVPILAVLLLFSMVGFYIAIILLLWYILILLFAYLLAVMVLGLWLMKVLKVRPDMSILDWKTALLGSVGMLILGFIPVVGWLVCIIIFLASVGGVLKISKQKWANSNQQLVIS